MTYQHGNEQDIQFADHGSRSNVEAELSRLDDASARIRNDMIASSNELAELRTELRAIEQQRSHLAPSPNG